MDERERVRGLASVEEARKARGKISWPPVKFWAYVGVALTVALIFHYKRTQGELEHERQSLLAKQRSMKAQLGERWFSLRDKVQKWTLDLQKDAGPELVDKEALAGFDFRSKPGIYLRMRAADAGSAEAIEKGAKNSLRDGFTSCMMTVANPIAAAGMACKRTRDCPSGEFCNETDHCSKAAQPFNLRVAYRTMSVLSDTWVHDVQDASTDIRIKLLAGTFDDTLRDDVPLAAELLTRAQYYMVVLDESAGEAEQARPAASDKKAGETVISAAESLQGLAHFARLALYRLSDDKPLLRLRREASANLIGATPVPDTETQAAAQRQANSCSLALAVRQAIGDENVPTVVP